MNCRIRTPKQKASAAITFLATRERFELPKLITFPVSLLSAGTSTNPICDFPFPVLLKDASLVKARRTPSKFNVCEVAHISGLVQLPIYYISALILMKSFPFVGTRSFPTLMIELLNILNVLYFLFCPIEVRGFSRAQYFSRLRFEPLTLLLFPIKEVLPPIPHESSTCKILTPESLSLFRLYKRHKSAFVACIPLTSI